MEKLGTIIIDGKIVDLDKMPIEELKQLQEKLKKDQEQTRKELDKLLEE